MQRVIRKRLSGPVREHSALVAADRIGQWTTGTLKMTLHAYLHLAIPAESRGINDGPANLFALRVAGIQSCQMGGTGTVTSLAVDTFRQVAIEHRLCTTQLRVWLHRRIPVVAEHAFIGNRTPEVVLVGAVVPRAHIPTSASFGIPACRQFGQLSVRCTGQVSTCMIPGADDEIDLLFQDVGFFAPKAKLVPSLEQLITAHDAFVVSVGGPIVKASEGVVV